MWLKIINLEQSLFPKLEGSMRSLSPKEENNRISYDILKV